MAEKVFDGDKAIECMDCKAAGLADRWVTEFDSCACGTSFADFDHDRINLDDQRW